VAQIFRSINSMSLKVVDFSWTGMGNDIFHQMRASEFLTQVKEVFLSGMKNISDRAFADWIRSKNCENLHSLDISWTRLGDPALSAILDSPVLTQLEVLNIDNLQGATSAGLSALLASEKADNFKALDLSRLPFTHAELIDSLVR
jgi:hypothetical protein